MGRRPPHTGWGAPGAGGWRMLCSGGGFPVSRAPARGWTEAASVRLLSSPRRLVFQSIARVDSSWKDAQSL